MQHAYEGRPNARIGYRSALVPLALLLGLIGAAAAADDEKICLPKGYIDPSPALEEACARYIRSGRARGKDLASAYNNRAMSLTQRGEHTRALQEQNEAIRLHPDFARYRLNRGMIYSDMGDFERALLDADDAVRLAPNNAEPRFWRGRVYEKKGDFDNAIAEFTAALKLNPRYDGAYASRCQAYFRKGEYARALHDCDEDVRLYPKSAGSYVARCMIFAAQGEFERALRDCDDGIRRNPQTITGHTWRGFIYEKKSEVARAIAEYQQALATDPANRVFTLPDSIGATLDDLRAYLARLRAPPAASSAASPTQGDARAIMEKHGLLGVWATNCSAAVSSQNMYIVFRPLDERRVQLDVMMGPTQRGDVSVIETVTEAGTDLTYTVANETRTLRVIGDRARIFARTVGGKTLVADGKVSIGTDTPWISKCQ